MNLIFKKKSYSFKLLTKLKNSRITYLTKSGWIIKLTNNEKSFLVITHYQRLLNFIKPDFVHVLAGGKIVKSGTKELAMELEKTGYANFI